MQPLARCAEEGVLWHTNTTHTRQGEHGMAGRGASRVAEPAIRLFLRATWYSLCVSVHDCSMLLVSHGCPWPQGGV